MYTDVYEMIILRTLTLADSVTGNTQQAEGSMCVYVCVFADPGPVCEQNQRVVLRSAVIVFVCVERGKRLSLVSNPEPQGSKEITLVNMWTHIHVHTCKLYNTWSS